MNIQESIQNIINSIQIKYPDRFAKKPYNDMSTQERWDVVIDLLLEKSEREIQNGEFYTDEEVTLLIDERIRNRKLAC